ncbi:MAG: hypothetical protein AB8B87_19615 [Granulosicoccus sp.]
MAQMPDLSLSSTARKGRIGVFAIACLVLFSPAVHAEYLGLIAGREATPAKSADLSVELGFVSGDLGEADYRNVAARVNYRLSPEVVLTGTAGTAEFGLTSGVPLGLGIIYHLSNQRISQKVEIAGKASYHFGDFSLRELDGDITSLALEVLVSGAEPIMNNGLAWYSNFGYHRIALDFGQSDSTNEIGIGAGLLLPTGLGEAYVGFDLIDELTFGLGIRYFVQ